MTSLPVNEAARALGERPGTLRRWIREGCPTVQRGHRGRGHVLLVDPDAVRTWLGAGEREAAILAIAGAAPGILAAAVIQAWSLADGVDKRRLAGVLAGTWYVSTTALLDHLRTLCAAVPEVTATPEEIARLRKIARND